MTEIRVLIVDDSAVSTKLLTKLLSPLTDLEVVGTAANGKLALPLIGQLRPDVVILDLEMPVMNGLETIVAMKQLAPHLPIIMLSALTAEGGALALEALEKGAADYIAKPGGLGSLASSTELRRVLHQKILQYTHLAQLAGASGPCSSEERAPISSDRPRTAPEVIAIGSSTGGPQALAKLLQGIAPTMMTPIVIVQHMPPEFTKVLATRLSSQCGRRVEEAFDGAVLSPGSIWVAPGDYHLTIQMIGSELGIRLTQKPPENSCRPSVDPLFRSVAELLGQGALGIILTGMGKDGFEGAKQLRASGGSLLVQDKSTSVIWGMPGFAVKAGLAQAVLSPDHLAAEINLRAQTRAGDISRKKVSN